jgi:hypothetical protein
MAQIILRFVVLVAGALSALGIAIAATIDFRKHNKGRK